MKNTTSPLVPARKQAIVDRPNVESFVTPAPLSSHQSPMDTSVNSSAISTPMDTIWWTASFPSSPITIGACVKCEGNGRRLLSTYLDIVFLLQFGFYIPRQKTDLGWLLNNLLQTAPLYHATLSISACFENGARQNTLDQGICINQETAKLQGFALSGLQDYVDELGASILSEKEMLKRVVNILAIMIQLLSLEVFSALDGNWELHLNGERSLLGMLQTRQFHNLLSERSHGESVTPIERALLDTSSADSQALQFYLTCFVWGDILAAATHGPQRHLPNNFNYSPLLRSGKMGPQGIMGCQSWVFIEIMEITALEVWKKDQVQRKSLSVLELAAKAGLINSRLKAGIESLMIRQKGGIPQINADSNSVTLCFAYAALVYLFVTVSDAYPDVQDISINVTTSLSALEALPSRLLFRVCWPYTIVGCLAQESEYEQFRNIMSRAKLLK
jgi:hypothetical protein